MATPVICRVRASPSRAASAKWAKKVGDTLNGDLLFSYETDKAGFEGSQGRRYAAGHLL